jgi:transcriptional regulator with XRE-family HTH domain
MAKSNPAKERRVLLKLAGVVLQYRGERNLTQEQLAAEAGITTRYLQQLEAGKANPSYLKLVGLASALGVETSSLIAAAEGLKSG